MDVNALLATMKNCVGCTIILALVSATAPLRVAGMDFPQLRHLRARATPAIQIKAAKDLIHRLVGVRVLEFDLNVNQSIGPLDRDTFQLRSANNGSIAIVGTSGVAVAMGFYHYLKYYCNGQRTWAGQQTELPPTLPVITSPIQITTNDKTPVTIIIITLVIWRNLPYSLLAE